MLDLIAAVFLAAAAPDTVIVTMKEVFVTGTRVPTQSLRVPAGVSAVDRRQFRDARGNSLKDGLNFVPGVFAQSRGGASDVRITIRGFGARGSGERSNSGSMRGIRVMTDGIPITEPDGRTSLDLPDLGSADRLEISRSNASTIYGNASGGVIQLLTNFDFDRPWVEVRQRAGSFGFHREQLVTGIPIGSARAKFSVSNSTFDGWRRHSENFSTQAQVRVLAPVGERANLRLLVDGVGDLIRFPGALTSGELARDPLLADSTWARRDERRRNRVGRVGMVYSHSLTDAQDLALSLFAEPKALQRSERDRFRDFTRQHVGGSASWSIARQLASGGLARFTAGGDEAFQDGAIQFYGLTPSGARATNLVADKREASGSGGLFAQVDVDWNEHWTTSGAVRWDVIRYISEDHMDPSLNADRIFSHATPKAAVAYRMENHTWYAAFGGGVEVPAFNEIDPPPPFDVLTSLNPFLEPTRSVSYELGSKGVAAMPASLGTLTYDAALYQIDVTNDLVPLSGGAFFETAGQTRRRGAELGLRWRPRKWLEANSSLTVTDNEYLEYRADTGSVNRGVYDGNQVAGLPPIQFAAQLVGTHSSGASLGVGVRAVDGVFADDANTLQSQNYMLLDATAAFEYAIGRQSFRFYVRGDNLTDADHVESVFINPVITSNRANIRWLEPGLPANWSAGVTVRFE
jgi:iron complex outermembrane receptor protein